MSDDIRKKIESELMEVSWEPLAEHYARDAVVLVTDSLDIIDVAEVVIKDDVEKLKVWLKDLAVHKPSPEQVQEWSKGATQFLCVIVQPYVLIQVMADRDQATTH